MLEPLYIATNCKAAYQLHWSLTLFAKVTWPEQAEWKERLDSAVEPDGVRLLEFRQTDSLTGQFFVSTKPEVSPAMRVPKGFASFEDGAGQLGEPLHLHGPAVERVEATDRADFAPAVLPQDERHAVAADNPPPFVGDRKRGRRQLERAMHGEDELLDLLPECLAFAELLQVLRLQEVAGQVSHLHEEAEIASLRRRPAARSLKYFDDRLRFSFEQERREDEQMVRGIVLRLHVGRGRRMAAGWTGGLSSRKSSTGSTKPRPMRVFQTRFTNERVK